MIEVSATDGLEVFTEGYIAPDRSPKTGTIARENCYFLSVFFQNENRKCNFFACLDILILCLELACCEDFEFCEIKCSALLSFSIDKNSRFCDILVCFEDLVVAHGVELALFEELAGGEHLADGVSLHIGFLLRLESLRSERKNRSDNHNDYCRIDDCIYISVSIHTYYIYYAILTFFALLEMVASVT